MKKKIKIFLCDMVHDYLGIGTHMFPLNIGFIAAYAYKHFPNEVEIKLFKYPNSLLKELKLTAPDIIGFGNYTWNADLNGRLAQFVKSKFKKTLVVFGGPNINHSEPEIKKFFERYRDIDFYVPFQGEPAFIDILREYIDCNSDLSKIDAYALNGVYSYVKSDNKAIIGKPVKRIKDPDEIPSPYLTGILDEFFDYNLIPIIETNRGCPYQCTFCTQGFSSHHQINFFDIERVKDEISYIAGHVKNTNLFHLADSNFGIVERDIEIARHIAETYKKTGYPRRSGVNWAKNQPNIVEIAKVLKNINLISSLQSLDNVVLEKVKRKNIEIPVFRDIVKKVNDLGGISGTEVILALPGETKESHIEGIKKIFDWDISYIICYNGLMLDGSELALAKNNGEFKCKTKYRLSDCSFGKYGDIASFEVEEGILSTDTMSMDEILSFRPAHWLIQFLWNYRFYYDFMKYIKSLGVNPFVFIIKLIESIESGAPDKIKAIFKEFGQEAIDEWFDSPEKLREHFLEPEKFKLLKEGAYGKINGKYIFRVLLEAKRDFEEYMYDIAANYSPEFFAKKDIFREIIDYLSVAIIDFNQSWDEMRSGKIVNLKHNLPEWRKSRYEKNIESFYDPKGFTFRLYLPKEQEEALKKLLKQYSHKNKNVTLRKMSEYMLLADFFYKSELIGEGAEKIRQGKYD